jgi:cell wall-associated NlpC family hydrolase
MTGDAIAARALALVGTPFRLHGRDPASGLDCIGLAAVATGLAASRVPTGYSHRGSAPARWHAWFADAGFAAVSDDPRPGDLILVQPGAAQTHLLVRVPDGHVHAHARLGRTIFAPGAPGWPVDTVWRTPAGRE